jgi:choline-sulfatase
VSGRPDIVLVMTDQQRRDQVGFGGNEVVRTPNLDLLAARGVVFEQAYSASTTCVPARTALMTGLLDHRVRHTKPYALEQGFWTVPHALRQAGYETALIGKMHFNPMRAEHGFDHMRVCEHLGAYGEGFETMDQIDHYHDWLAGRGLPDWRYEVPKGTRAPYVYDLETHPTEWVRDETLRFLAARDEGKPLFLVVSFPHPHPPLNPPEPYASMYDPDDCPIDPAWADVNLGLPRRFRKLTAQPDAPNRRVDPERLPAHRRQLALSYGLITQIDDAVGRVVEHLDLDTSFLFFTADHGDFAGHRGLLRKVPWLPFDDLARVPCFAVGGPVEGGRRERYPVQSFDFGMTALEYAGVDPPSDELDGRSMASYLADADAAIAPDRAVFSAISMRCPMVRRGRFKYIRLLGFGQEVLFDMEDDPDESVNLMEDERHAEVVADLRSEVDRQLAATVPDLPTFARA